MRKYLVILFLVALISGASAKVVGESGSVSLSSTIDDGVTQTVNLDNSYDNPVVVAYIETRNGGQSIDVRVRNVGSSSFEVFMEEPDDQAHATEEIGYVVMEKGTHTLDGGVKVEAGTHSTSNVHRGGNNFNGDSVSFNQNFSSQPVLLHTLNSYNNGGFMSTVSPSVGSSSFTIQQEAGETGESATTETIGWIAVENLGGSVNTNGYKMVSKVHASDGDNDGVDNSVETFSYSFSNTPDVVIDGTTGNGIDGYWARSGGTHGTGSSDVYAEEDQVSDTERGHASEGFSYLAFENGAILETASILKSQSNSEAPPGSLWIEEADFHWANGTQEFYLNNATKVGSIGAYYGAVWIENSSLRFIDAFGFERKYKAPVFDSNSNAPPGSVWIENGYLHYVDGSGTERVADGT